MALVLLFLFLGPEPGHVRAWAMRMSGLVAISQATHGFIMDLANFRWDVLGKVEACLVCEHEN